MDPIFLINYDPIRQPHVQVEVRAVLEVVPCRDLGPCVRHILVLGGGLGSGAPEEGAHEVDDQGAQD